ESMYRAVDQDRVLGTERLHMHKLSRVTGVEEDTDGATLTVEHLPSGKQRPLRADYVVYATGYHPADPLALLGDLAEHVVTDARGRHAVDRDSRLVTDDDVTCGIYLQGGTEHTHGISSSLLSNVALRAGELLDSVRARTS